MTQAGNLQCKKIIHISAQSNAIMIQKHVKKALEMCAKEKLTSIAFPAIGTGENRKKNRWGKSDVIIYLCHTMTVLKYKEIIWIQFL